MAVRLEKTLIYFFLIAGAVIMVMPFGWMISTSLKSQSEVFSYPPEWIPSTLLWDNYVRAWQAAPFGRYFFNSLLVAAAVTLGTLVTSSLAAFSFARIRFPGREALFAVYLSSMMIPHQMTIIPSFLVLRNLGDLSPALGLDSYFALIAPFLASAFGVFCCASPS